jgi:hypothetical protein
MFDRNEQERLTTKSLGAIVVVHAIPEQASMTSLPFIHPIPPIHIRFEMLHDHHPSTLRNTSLGYLILLPKTI